MQELIVAELCNYSIKSTKNQRIMNSGKVFLSILAGAAAGALAGILFAPAKGKNTRKKILKKGEDYVGSLKEKTDQLFDSFSEKFEKLKGEVADFTKKVKKETPDYTEEKMS
ncbi:MAG: YtxH domain-containing protein [Lentimicrobium sp.]|nr:YtxH domain-containing protein [Lentimicrobium sp.]